MCANDNPIQLGGGYPSGGIYFGNGVSAGIFNPSIVGGGYHNVHYTVNGDTASSMIQVYALPDASFLTTGPFCDNESNIQLSSVTTGGIYSGNGVVSSTFNPNLLGFGSYWISYTLVDNNNCTQIEDTLIIVNSAPSIPIINQNANQLICNSTGVSYQWMDDNMNPISGETNSTFSPTSNGTYYVEVSNSNCTEVSEGIVFSLTSISEIIECKIKIYESTLVIESSQFIKQVLLYDIMGKIVNQSKNNTIDTTDLCDGIYLLKINMTNKTIIRKVLL
jgi:hypothetical protein